jgi:hypothetical protein
LIDDLADLARLDLALQNPEHSLDRKIQIEFVMAAGVLADGVEKFLPGADIARHGGGLPALEIDAAYHRRPRNHPGLAREEARAKLDRFG